MASVVNTRTVGLLPAAGLARRLGDISGPKELIPVDGRPVIDYSVDHLVDTGVDEIVVVIRPSKESIKDHLEHTYPEERFSFVYQEGPIGNLLDAIKAAESAVADSKVLFLMPDTIIQPNPFRSIPPGEVTLLCFEASGDEWRHFGVVSAERHEIIDKPDRFVGQVCWGALAWEPQFTRRVVGHKLLPDALNEADWSHVVSIDSYRDIGTGVP
jgi:dTDP-glucose pyrophosphorylase